MPLLRLVFSLIAVAACGQPSQRPVAQSASPSPLERAEAFETGHGPGRDYRQATAIYAAACADGRGDLRACRRLLRAIGDARGIEGDRGEIGRLLVPMCRRRDLLACYLVAAIDRELARAGVAHVDADQLATACERGDVAACEDAMVIEPTNWKGSSGLQGKLDDLHAHACRAGLLDGCYALLASLRQCSYAPGPTRCANHLERGWRASEGSPPQLDALARTRSACDRGDASACDILPGREIARAELCKANDYGACAELGCLGDAAAAAIGRAHHARDRCDDVRHRDAARREVPRTRDAMPAEPPITVAAAPRRPFHSVAFRRLATEEDHWEWPRFEVYNLGDRPITALRVRVYAYDRAGNQVAQTRADDLQLDIAPGASDSPYSIARDPMYIPDEAATFEVCYDAIRLAGPQITDSARCPDLRPRGDRGPALDGGGSMVQARLHAAATPLAAHYGSSFGDRDGASARGLDDLARGAIDFAGSEVPSPGADAVNLPILIDAVGIIYNVKGVTSLRLSPATLAKIVGGDITTWSDPAIARDNPRTRLPAEPIVLLHEVANGDDTLDRDVDTTRQLVAYLDRAARAAWHRGGPDRFAWPAGVRRAMGLVGIVYATEGAISYLDLSTGTADGVPRYASIRNRAGAYVAPTEASLLAAARQFAGKPGPIDATDPAAYPIAFASWIVTPRHPRPEVAPYLRYLLGDGQNLLAKLGLARLPDALAARSRALVDALP